MQYETCCHIKEDGSYCGSPALRDRKYCYYHLMDRGRRLRRARALRDNLPYRLEIQSLDTPYAVRAAITEIVQALGARQLDSQTAGKMLYGVQQAVAMNKLIAQMEAAPAKTQNNAEALSHPAEDSRVREYPGFEKEFGITPGTDIDAETEWTLRKADEEAELRQVNALPTPPAGVRPGSAQYRVYREEAYQAMNMQLNSMKHQLRDYYEEKRQQSEKQRKEMLSATAPPGQLVESA